MKAARKPVAKEVPAEEPVVEAEPAYELKQPEPQELKQPHKAIPSMLFQEPS